MNNIDIEKKYNLCIENCNGILTNLYAELDRIGERIDRLVTRGIDTTSAEAEYDNICEDINHICNWRGEHLDAYLKKMQDLAEVKERSNTKDIAYILIKEQQRFINKTRFEREIFDQARQDLAIKTKLNRIKRKGDKV